MFLFMLAEVQHCIEVEATLEFTSNYTSIQIIHDKLSWNLLWMDQNFYPEIMRFNFTVQPTFVSKLTGLEIVP
jgi:hypothetical protein